MEFHSLNQYLQEVSTALDECDGEALASFVSFKDPHIANSKLQRDDPEGSCQRYLESPYDKLFAAHVKACFSVASHNFKDAHGYQVLAIQSFVKAFQLQKDENWALPIMYALILDLRTFANNADRELQRTGKGKKGDMLEKAADTVMSCFRVCASDGRSSIEVSKKWGMLFLVNQLFKIYFRIGKLHLCKPLIRAIESNNIKERFTLAQRVTYKFYVGRKAMFDSDYKMADDYLTFAFENCHRNCKKNLRMIMTYLVPVKMLLGNLPPQELLERHNLTHFGAVAQSVRTGNVQLLDKTLETHETFFIKTGVYLILEKLRAVVLRTLFKKVTELLKTHQVPLQAFQDALEMQGLADIDMDETECIVAGLIYSGNIKGYISHQHKKLVVSKVNPFPPIAALS
ncbi:PCI domain-containing protein 2-like isoform X1 [Styela clava]|uniref:PCI domain-containing protein 2-like n=1 Tax=Styela clava TaxID=7725 RepID=UPI001939FF85|nr:PCI domain-containing protein 2-like [Styela clava]